jgi:hypothetical protein
MPTRKTRRILAELEHALVLEGLSEESASEYIDGVEQEIEDLLGEEEDSSETDKES